MLLRTLPSASPGVKVGVGTAFVLLIAEMYFFSVQLQAQDLEQNHRYVAAGTFGLSTVETEFGTGDMNGNGPAIGVRIGRRFSSRLSIMLEYSVHHFNDQSPRISDIRVDTTTFDGGEFYRTTFVRTPKVLQTNYLLLQAQYYFYRGFYSRISPGVAWHRFAAYTVPAGAVLDAGTSDEIGIAYGIAAGYEHLISRSLAISLEALYQWSSGEDSTNPRRAIGVNAAALWYF